MKKKFTDANGESEANKPASLYYLILTTLLPDILAENAVCKTCKQDMLKLVENETRCISIGH